MSFIIFLCGFYTEISNEINCTEKKQCQRLFLGFIKTGRTYEPIKFHTYQTKQLINAKFSDLFTLDSKISTEDKIILIHDTLINHFFSTGQFIYMTNRNFFIDILLFIF